MSILGGKEGRGRVMGLVFNPNNLEESSLELTYFLKKEKLQKKNSKHI